MNLVLLIGWFMTMAAALRLAFKQADTVRSEALMAAELESAREKIAILVEDNKQKERQNEALSSASGTVSASISRSVRNWADRLNASLDPKEPTVLVAPSEGSTQRAGRLVTDIAGEREPSAGDTNPGSVARSGTERAGHGDVDGNDEGGVR